VLGELHRGLQVLLGQDQGDGETDDGLEAGACFISETGHQLVFAGARLSLWRTTGGAVDEIKGDRAGIGYRRFANDLSFTDVPLALENGSAFYLTTDGLIDQVGGPRRISFGKRRFAAFIAEHQARPMPEQGEALRQAVATYQGGERRRDDLTVLGFTPRAA
jgi:serine phosphatase RsbU (regulator of sigma subunit)